ncbi:MAG TPA: metal ABC transporter permease [Clostridiales bacterium]|nr:metal ABC transporter permease [Clostridiales bacterium]
MDILYALFEKLPFSWTQYGFMVNAFIAVLLISPLLGTLGTMTVNNKMAFFSDALGHSALTGIAIGVMIGIDNMLISMVAFGILLSLIIMKVKATNSASADTIISVFSSTSVALGLVILSIGGGFSKYSQYLIGDILAITSKDLLLLFVLLIVVLLIWGLIYNKLLLVSLNADLAASRGIKHRLIENIFVVLVAVVVMLSIKWIGVLLINSLLILPAAAARNIAKNSKQHLIYTISISLLSGIIGLILSFYINSSSGATIVLTSAIMFFITLLIRKLSERS